MMGGIPAVGWNDLIVGGLCVGIAFVWLMRQERALDLMLFGDDLASVKGVNVRVLTRTAFVLTSLVVGWIVSQCGVIGFVGIIIPAIGRIIIGLRHKNLLPLSALLGASLVVLCDVLGRLVIAPFEIPAGVFTSVLGGPIFILLMMRPSRVQGTLL
jgi:iron complex transport system permease protein